MKNPYKVSVWDISCVPPQIHSTRSLLQFHPDLDHLPTDATWQWLASFFLAQTLWHWMPEITLGTCACTTQKYLELIYMWPLLTSGVGNWWINALLPSSIPQAVSSEIHFIRFLWKPCGNEHQSPLTVANSNLRSHRLTLHLSLPVHHSWFLGITSQTACITNLCLNSAFGKT